MKRICSLLLAALLVGTMVSCGSQTPPEQSQQPEPPVSSSTSEQENAPKIPDNFILVEGGIFSMGSPDSEAWRSDDETLHTVTVSDFYMSAFEVTQAEYQSVTGSNPSAFSGEDLPVETVSWLDAIAYCNVRSELEGLEPAYTIEGQTVTWNRSANGYRLPTEAEWEYACRAGTQTPFNTETSISAEESNYWGHYPYLIEDNYFNQSNLETPPGVYRETTVAVGSFQPNAWGFYDMHGNEGEWVWDYYGDYHTEAQTDPSGPDSGVLRVNRGGGWNDFAKNLRSAYRATLPQDSAVFNVGFRLVRNAVAGSGTVTGSNLESTGTQGGNVLIAYFSWGGNTRGIAEEIQAQTGADLFEIQLVEPYSTDYNTVLEQAQQDQNAQARPELSTHVEDLEQYDTILLGYPNWWASIPMPVASFLEEYDFTGKTIVPFCSHGGGRFGQSLTAITKLVPEAELGEGLAISYSGGSGMPDDVAAWLAENQIPTI